ncbi:MAG: DUF1311 domain-containing protein [Pseudorhodoplanes sp.]|nr:MAG: DUF1311 domain-containing protein [Pseudorhodoplanes sp.]MBZ0140914.1 DUF1311 domain-containing protein [Pseudorhodoplanes sp.]
MNRVIAAAIVAAVIAAQNIPARAQPAPPADIAAIEACLKKAEDDNRFGTACIGLIAYPCRDKAQGDIAKTKACAARELAAWSALMATAVKRVQAGGFKEINAAVAESEKGWIKLRDSLCPVFDKVEPGTLPGDAAYCRLQTTAHRVLLLRKLADAVNER